MDFSSLVLMERDKDTGFMTKELGSYEVGEGAEYIKKMFYDGDKINVYFDTNRDVEDWEYSAVFDLFNEDKFIEQEYNIEQIDDEYNPTWIVKFDYNEEHSIVLARLNNLCSLIKTHIGEAFENVKGKEEEYK
ncbi:DUF6762 family protein [Clostridium sp. OS1-26]|uniref:DUF6762 family protein n=1 Tax=Clostridium sp. OS1-26 TaxID=3070681 RepID=UPI0027E15EA0|nr:DUF6762 family protein [Clostridium sp. OS1-26]WML36828.1 hypothetical protein RCG18_09485 [Clostridium sp. OS1-26]